MLRILVLLTIFLFCQTVQSDDVVDSSKAAFEKLTDEVQQQALDTSADAINRIDSQETAIPLAPTPELFNQITQPSGQSIDIDALANQGQQLFRSAEQSAKRYESQVLVFISSSMPEQTVIHYLQQARRIDASLVLRGFVGDTLLNTKRYIHDILMASGDPEAPSSILIDPTLYQRFSITRVPSIVVTESAIEPCREEACAPPVHHLVGGDVSLDWALGLVSRQIASEVLKTLLKPMINTLEGKG